MWTDLPGRIPSTTAAGSRGSGSGSKSAKLEKPSASFSSSCKLDLFLSGVARRSFRWCSLRGRGRLLVLEIYGKVTFVTHAHPNGWSSLTCVTTPASSETNLCCLCSTS